MSPANLAWVLPGVLPPALQPSPALGEHWDRCVLACFKAPSADTSTPLKTLCAGLAAGAAAEHRVFWGVAAAFFEALELGLLPHDVNTKRVVAGVWRQHTAWAQGPVAMAPEVWNGLWEAVAPAAAAGAVTPWLAAVRQAHPGPDSQADPPPAEPQDLNDFLNEADAWSHGLSQAMADWQAQVPQRPLPETCVSWAQALAQAADRIGHGALSGLLAALAAACDTARVQAQAGRPPSAEEVALLCDAAQETRRLLHQFAAGFVKDPPPALTDALAGFAQRDAAP